MFVPWEDHLRTLGIPTRLVAISAEPLRGEEYFEHVFTAAFAKWPWPSVVFLYGPNGNGKTHMGTWLFWMWHGRQMRGWSDARDRGEVGIGTRIFQPRAMWTTERSLTEALKAYNNERFSFREQAQVFVLPEILMIDDVFTERTSETDVSNVTDILESRRNAGKITIITSNRGPIEIADRYSGRLAERLIDDALVVEFTGSSHRMRRYLSDAS